MDQTVPELHYSIASIPPRDDPHDIDPVDQIQV